MTKWLGNFVFFKNNMLKSSAFCTETQILESPNPAPALSQSGLPDLGNEKSYWRSPGGKTTRVSQKTPCLYKFNQRF